MSRRRKKFVYYKDIVQGHFRLGDEKPGQQGRRLKLCTKEEAVYKHTSRGKVKRSKKEISHFLENLYYDKLQFLMHEKVEADRRAKTPFISELMEEWIKSRENTRARRTIKESNYLKNDYLAVNGDHQICDFDDKNIDYLIEYYKGIGNRDATINKKLRELKTFLNWVYEKEYFDRPVKVKKLRETKRMPVILTYEQEMKLVKRILGLIRTPNSIERQFAYYIHFRAYVMLSQTGMRRAELLHLKLENINMKRRVIQIRDDYVDEYVIKERKEKNIPISDALNEFLSSDLQERETNEIYYLDDGRGNRYFEWADSLTAIFGNHLRKIGVKGVKPLHGFRATVASRLLNDFGVDISHVKEILGHSDISTTLIYKDAAMAPLKKAVSSLSSGQQKIKFPKLKKK